MHDDAYPRKRADELALGDWIIYSGEGRPVLDVVENDGKMEIYLNRGTRLTVLKGRTFNLQTKR